MRRDEIYVFSIHPRWRMFSDSRAATTRGKEETSSGRSNVVKNTLFVKIIYNQGNVNNAALRAQRHAAFLADKARISKIDVVRIIK